MQATSVSGFALCRCAHHGALLCARHRMLCNPVFNVLASNKITIQRQDCAATLPQCCLCGLRCSRVITSHHGHRSRSKRRIPCRYAHDSAPFIHAIQLLARSFASLRWWADSEGGSQSAGSSRLRSMGVTGLWPLLEPVGRRINIQALAGKCLAIGACTAASMCRKNASEAC